jgi:hypothetical protein
MSGSSKDSNDPSGSSDPSNSSESSKESNPKSRTVSISSSSSGSKKGLKALLIQNMNEIAASQLATRRKDNKKSSMASRMGPETEKMFVILSSRDWDKRKPRLNSFMARLMEDKGMSQACELVKSKLRHGEGAVTENGLIQFLSNGYICKTMDDRLGGFTFFLFRPHYIAGGHDSKLVEQSIRETFGDAKLTDNIVRYYARMNFCLPA